MSTESGPTNRSVALHEDELFLAWCDRSYANGAVAGWNAAIAYMSIHLKRERDFWANNKPYNQDPVPAPFLDGIGRTASAARAVIAQNSGVRR